MNSTYLMLLSIITLNCIVDSAFCAENPPANTMDDFVRVSRSDNRYFEFSDGTPYIPNGFNLVSAPGMDEVENIFEIMAQNRVNYCRLWIGQDPLDVEHEKSGQYDPERAERSARVIELAHRYGIRLKLCIEYFRDLVPERKTWSDRPWHHVANGGRYESMAEFLESEEGIEHFKQKLRWFADRFGNEPAIFGWELWNGMNAVRGGSSGIWIPLDEIMLAELQQLFPQNLVMQSLGSFDGDHARVHTGHSASWRIMTWHRCIVIWIWERSWRSVMVQWIFWQRMQFGITGVPAGKADFISRERSG